MMLGKEAVETGEYDHLPLKYKWAKNKFFSCLKVLSLFLEFCLELISLTLYSKTWLITSDILTTIFCLFSSFLLSHCSKRLLSDFCENVNFINFESFERRWSTTENSIRFRNKFEKYGKRIPFYEVSAGLP